MQDKQALSFIVKEAAIEEEFKGYCIDQNAYLLQELATKPEKQEDVELAIQAMNIYPIEQVVTPLRATIEHQQKTRRTTYQNQLEVDEKEMNQINEKNKR